MGHSKAYTLARGISVCQGYQHSRCPCRRLRDGRSTSKRTGIWQGKLKTTPPWMTRGFASAPEIKQVFAWNFLILSSRALRSTIYFE